jgi:hypothetical protein
MEHPSILEDPENQLNQMSKKFTNAISRIATEFQTNIKQEVYTEKLEYDRTWLEMVMHEYNPEEDTLDEVLEKALNRTYNTYKKEGDPPAESMSTTEKIVKAKHGLDFHAQKGKPPTKRNNNQWTHNRSEILRKAGIQLWKHKHLCENTKQKIRETHQQLHKANNYKTETETSSNK